MKPSTLAQLAIKLSGDSARAEDMAEFIRLVSSEHRLGELKALLPLNHDCVGTVLQRIAELVPGDPKLYLSLALWRYHYGLDDQALELVEKAREIAPCDQDVLRADVWFSYSCSPELIHQKCDMLLNEFPNDEWAKEVRREISENGALRELRSPHWNNSWEDLISGRQSPAL